MNRKLLIFSLLLALAAVVPLRAQPQIYSNTFSSQSDFNTMSVIDANNDTKIWSYSANNGGCARYSYNTSKAADDWLITPGITLEAGKTYQFGIDAWAQGTAFPERLEVKMGTAATAADMTTTVIASTDITSTTAVTLSNYSVTVAATGTYYFGIHAISDKDMYYLNVDNLMIADITPEPQAIEKLAVSSITARTATASWIGNGNPQSYNLRYREVVKDDVTADFEDSSLDGWTTIDADGDGYNWILGSAIGGVYFSEGASMAGSGHSATDLVVSGSFSNVTGVGALTPDNYLVSPKVKLGGSISFWAKGQDADYFAETFGVAVSTTGNTSAADFTMVGEKKTATAGWVQYTFDLSAYAGQEGYVAIRHYDISDMFILDVDDIIIAQPVEQNPWITVNNLDANTYEFTGLTPTTEYELQVQAVFVDGTSDWTASVNFTTLSADAKPIDVAVNKVTWHSGEASWNGSQDSYNLRYRKVTLFESFETFPGNWTIVDNDGDGYNWQQSDLTTSFSGHYEAIEGSNVAMSRSWINSTVGAVTPDNWLISPQVDLGGMLRYYVKDEAGYPETYRIYVSTTGNNISDFQPLTSDLATPGNNIWSELTADLSAYNGQRGYIAFRHYNCTDQSFMFIDAVSIGDKWTTVGDVTSPYTIEGLEAECQYEVQVQGNIDGGTTIWTLPTLFATTATGLVVNNVTSNSGEASWNGNQGSFNLRYRKADYFWDMDTEDQLDGWNFIDANNDGEGWFWRSIRDQGGISAFFSASDYAGADIEEPNNWLITPEVELGGKLKLIAWGAGLEGAEVLGVYVGPATYSSDIADYTQIGTDITVNHNKTEYEFDLSGYEGTGRLAIVHHNCKKQYYLVVDDIKVFAPDWTTVNNVSSPYTIEGLEEITEYEVQVQGNLDDGTTRWSGSVYFTTLAGPPVATTLAELCSTGMRKRLYTISDQLIAVDYAEVRDNDVYLFCKDQGNVSISPTEIFNGQIDFMTQHGEQQGAWDQSNWIALKLTGTAGLEKATEAISGPDKLKHYIEGGTITGKLIDQVNHVLELENNELTVGEVAYYTPNVYSIANFNLNNLNLYGGHGAQIAGDSQTFYFFMNPKIQEYCKVTYAQWDADNNCFVVPDASGFSGTVAVDWSYNVSSNWQNTVNDEDHGKSYSFNAVVKRGTPRTYLGLKAKTTDFELLPTNLTRDKELPTSINDMVIDGNRNVTAVEYYNSLGQRSNKPFDGINIVVSRYSDGSSSVKKIFKE